MLITSLLLSTLSVSFVSAAFPFQQRIFGAGRTNPTCGPDGSITSSGVASTRIVEEYGYLPPWPTLSLFPSATLISPTTGLTGSVHTATYEEAKATSIVLPCNVGGETCGAFSYITTPVTVEYTVKHVYPTTTSIPVVSTWSTTTTVITSVVSAFVACETGTVEPEAPYNGPIWTQFTTQGGSSTIRFTVTGNSGQFRLIDGGKLGNAAKFRLTIGDQDTVEFPVSAAGVCPNPTHGERCIERQASLADAWLGPGSHVAYIEYSGQAGGSFALDGSEGVGGYIVDNF